MLLDQNKFLTNFKTFASSDVFSFFIDILVVINLFLFATSGDNPCQKMLVISGSKNRKGEHFVTIFTFHLWGDPS